MLFLAQKTSQVALHMSVAFAVMFVCTGSLALGGVAAILEPICNVLLLPLHDSLWKRIAHRMESKVSHGGHARPMQRPSSSQYPLINASGRTLATTLAASAHASSRTFNPA